LKEHNVNAKNIRIGLLQGVKDNFSVKAIGFIYFFYSFRFILFGQNGLDVFFKQSDTLNTSKNTVLAALRPGYW
jgi:hypothetical protein